MARVYHSFSEHRVLSHCRKQTTKQETMLMRMVTMMMTRTMMTTMRMGMRRQTRQTMARKRRLERLQTRPVSRRYAVCVAARARCMQTPSHAMSVFLMWNFRYVMAVHLCRAPLAKQAPRQRSGKRRRVMTKRYTPSCSPHAGETGSGVSEPHSAATCCGEKGRAWPGTAFWASAAARLHGMRLCEAWLI